MRDGKRLGRRGTAAAGAGPVVPGVILFGAILLGPAQPAAAQAFEVRGGSSSLYDAQGGTVWMHAASFDASAGAGVVAGRLVGGLQAKKVIGGSTYTVGTETIPFQLETDIFEDGFYLNGVGASVERRRPERDLFAFAGATSTTFDSPFFEGAQAEEPAGILFLKDRPARRVEVESAVLLAQRLTLIEGVAFAASPSLHLAVSAGVGEGQPYGAASLKMRGEHYDVKAAYIDTGSRFRRVDATAPLIAEPVRENVELTLHPASRLALSLTRRNYQTPLVNRPDGVRSNVNQGAINLHIAGTSLSMTVFESSFDGTRDLGEMMMADRPLGPHADLAMSWLESRPASGNATRSLMTTFSRQVSPHLDLSLTDNTSAGGNTLSAGGSWLSNLAEVSVQYQTYYVPQLVQQPFEQATMIDARVRPWRGVTLGMGTLMMANGKVGYTAELEAAMGERGAPSPSTRQSELGAMVLRGCVRDPSGAGVAGAALAIDGRAIYADSEGCFSLREHKAARHTLEVLGSDFLDGSRYQVVSAPRVVTSAPESRAAEIRIVVRAIEGSETGGRGD